MLVLIRLYTSCIDNLAGVAKLADAPDSKSGSRKGVGVQVPPPAPLKLKDSQEIVSPFAFVMSKAKTKGKDNMKNVSIKVNANNLMTIEVDLNQDFGPSKSGKTIIIASTEGNQSLEEHGVTVGLNIYKKP